LIAEYTEEAEIDLHHPQVVEENRSEIRILGE